MRRGILRGDNRQGYGDRSVATDAQLALPHFFAFALFQALLCPPQTFGESAQAIAVIQRVRSSSKARSDRAAFQFDQSIEFDALRLGMDKRRTCTSCFETDFLTQAFVIAIPLAVSARHVHLSREAVDMLFGAGYQLTQAQPLRQPGHWAAGERVTLEGPKGRIEGVAILGPERTRTQIGISRTDGFALGIDPPVRDSGKLDGTPTVRLIGPAGHLDTDGLIIAARHIHTSPEEPRRGVPRR